MKFLQLFSNIKNLLDGGEELAKKRKELTEKIEVPDDLLCEISFDIPKHPIFTVWGHLYDEGVLDDWLNNNDNKCPHTRNIVSKDEHILKISSITEFFKEIQGFYTVFIIDEINKTSIKDLKKFSNKIDEANQQFTDEYQRTLSNYFLKALAVDLSIYMEYRCFFTEAIPNTPVLTKIGNLFEKEELVDWINDYGICPISGIALTQNDFFEYPSLTQLLQEFKHEFALNQEFENLIKLIVQLTLENKNEVFIKYHNFIMNLRSKNERYLNIKKQASIYVKNRDDISQLKSRLKLDINNTEHLAFWQKQVFGVKGGTCLEIQFDGNSYTYRVPARVKKLFELADKDYATKDDLLNAINTQRNQSVNRFSSPFSSFFRNKETTEKLYKTPNDEIQNLEFSHS